MKNALFPALLALATAACAADLAAPAPDDPDEGTPSDDELVRGAASIPPDLTLPTGNAITFVPVPGEGGRVVGHVIVERVPEGAPSGLELAGALAPDLDARELFRALAEPGAPLPAALVDDAAQAAAPRPLASSLRADFLAAAATTSPVALVAPDLACDNTSFNGWSWVPGGAVGGDDFIRNDKTPTNYNAFTSYCYNPYADGHCHGDRYMYRAWWETDGEWVGKVCGHSVGEATHWAHGNDYVGPRLSFQRFTDAWETLTFSGGFASWSVPANATQRFYYRYIGSPEELAVRIYDAYAFDEFDIMMNK